MWNSPFLKKQYFGSLVFYVFIIVNIGILVSIFKNFSLAVYRIPDQYSSHCQCRENQGEIEKLLQFGRDGDTTKYNMVFCI